MGFWGNLFFQNGIGKAIDPFELTGIGKDAEASNLEGFEIPTFEEDPDYRETQDLLKKLGIDILGGDIPDYYSGIGETGSPEFENLLSLMKGDVQSSVESAAAATGRTGGVVASQTAEKVGKLSTEARFEDYVRALQGKESLLNKGVGITESVRGAGQTQQAQENQFSLSAAGLDLEKRLGLDLQDAQQGEALGKLAEVGLGAAAGFITGGPTGAIVGAAGGYDYTKLLQDSADREKVDTPVGTAKEEEFGLGLIKRKPLTGAVA